ncbi:MAG: hypothetical protein V1705_02200 [bacterium]
MIMVSVRFDSPGEASVAVKVLKKLKDYDRFISGMTSPENPLAFQFSSETVNRILSAFRQAARGRDFLGANEEELLCLVEKFEEAAEVAGVYV